MSTISKFTLFSSEALLASHQVAHKIAEPECEKLHADAVELILPAAVDLTSTMIGERDAEKLNLVTQSDNAMCR